MHLKVSFLAAFRDLDAFCAKKSSLFAFFGFFLNHMGKKPLFMVYLQSQMVSG